MHDLVIRNGTIVDGTGRQRFRGDLAVDGATISEVGRVRERGRREIDAEGLLVTPGFVDIHTHYDGQATWDSELAPSSWHGVTSIVMGNCGVGFAPAAPDKHDFLISLMEGVEDIPGAALAEGLTWEWESLPQYLDALDRRPHAIDLGAQVPHAALRAYVMGERGADHEIDPTPGEIRRMADLTAEALLAGALGFATSRTVNHRSRTGARIGSLTASSEELLGIGQALKETGRGVFQCISDFLDLEYEFGLIRRMAAECGRPLSLTLLQRNDQPEKWREILARIERAAAEGVDIKGQVCARPVGLLIGL
ncbi:MAG TPA: amidohydrolase family protein, partial [Dehalococcoidia bacterium]|nr:amidohydrolase family protein [Dehalococcoidia bacterium]